MDPIRLEFRREVHAPPEVVWKAMANTDAFNRAAGLGFEFGEEPQPDGTVRRWGRVRRLGQNIEWDELPFRFTAPGAFESIREFRGGPLKTAVARFRLEETAEVTIIHYTIELTPRMWLARPVVAADARLNTGPPIVRALDRVVEAIEEDRPDFDPPPALEDWALANLDAGLAGVQERDVARALKHIVTQAPLITQCRIQPLRMARQTGLPAQTILEGCLEAVAGGALEARFLLLCPICLGVKEELSTLDFTRRDVHCPSCNIGFDGSLIDNVEIAFRPNDRIREFEPPVDCVQSPSRTPHVLAQQPVAQGQMLHLAVAMEQGCHRLDVTPIRGALHIEVVENGPSSIVVDLTDRGTFPRRAEVGSGTVDFYIRSRLERPCTVSIAERWRPPAVMTVAEFLENGLAARWALENHALERAPFDGFAIVVGLAEPWTAQSHETQVADIEAVMARLKVRFCQVANGRVVAVVEDLRHALRVVERVAGAQRTVALAGGGAVAIEGAFGEFVVGVAVDRAMTVLRGIGWGRTGLDTALAESAHFARVLKEFRGRIDLVEGWGARPAMLRFTELAARDHVVTVDDEATFDTKRVGPFVLGELLGSGGMGAVFFAKHHQTQQQVVLKLLHEDLARDFKYAAAFYQEARLGWSVNHPRVGRVLDWGIDTQRRCLFMTMAPIEGITLLAHLKKVGQLDAEATLKLANELLEGLSAIHDAGVVHRDLKPANVMMTDHGAVLIDFGVALPMDGERSRVAGTQSYMSPEQSRGRVLDERSDLYQLAVLLCRVSTRKWPFQGKSPVERLKWRDSNAVTSLPDAVPEALVPVLLKALSMEPADRYPTARAMRAALT